MHITVKMSKNAENCLSLINQNRSAHFRKAAKKLAAKKNIFLSLIRPIFLCSFQKSNFYNCQKYTLAKKQLRSSHSLYAGSLIHWYMIHWHWSLSGWRLPTCANMQVYYLGKKYQTDRSIYQFAIAIEKTRQE